MSELCQQLCSACCDACDHAQARVAEAARPARVLQACTTLLPPDPRLPCADMLQRLLEREGAQGKQHSAANSYLQADTASGQRNAVITDYVIRILGLDVRPSPCTVCMDGKARAAQNQGGVSVHCDGNRVQTSAESA